MMADFMSTSMPTASTQHDFVQFPPPPIQRWHLSEHRDWKPENRSACAPGRAVPCLRPEHDGAVHFVVHLIVVLFAAFIQAHDPDVFFFQIQRARDVCDLRYREVLARSRRIGDGRRYRRGPPLRITTPSAPAASAVRRIAPRLCGSSMPSSTTISERSPRREATRLLSRSLYCFADVAATSPWCAVLPASSSSSILGKTRTELRSCGTRRSRVACGYLYAPWPRPPLEVSAARLERFGNSIDSVENIHANQVYRAPGFRCDGRW